eukprot:scaffold370760_cov15-Prasinocladus_malaysianus.AAC.1
MSISQPQPQRKHASRPICLLMRNSHDNSTSGRPIGCFVASITSRAHTHTAAGRVAVPHLDYSLTE